jgi:hypothetical protein
MRKEGKNKRGREKKGMEEGKNEIKNEGRDRRRE